MSGSRVRHVTAAAPPSPPPPPSPAAATEHTAPEQHAVRAAKRAVQPTGVPVSGGRGGRGVLRGHGVLRTALVVERVRTNVGRGNDDNDDDDAAAAAAPGRCHSASREWQTSDVGTATQSGHHGAEAARQHGEPGRRVRG